MAVCIYFSPSTLLLSQSQTGWLSNPGIYIFYTKIREYFWGYRPITPRNNPGCTGYLAEPEKAMIDLFYYLQEEVDKAFIDSLRLQNTEQLNPAQEFAAQPGIFKKFPHPV